MQSWERIQPLPSPHRPLSSIEFRLRRFLAELGFVFCGVFLHFLRVANEALRVGTVVLFAPIALLLEIGRDLGVALSAFGFVNTVLVAPPAVVTVAALFLAVIVTVAIVMFVAVFVAGMIDVVSLRDLWRSGVLATADKAIA